MTSQSTHPKPYTNVFTRSITCWYKFSTCTKLSSNTIPFFFIIWSTTIPKTITCNHISHRNQNNKKQKKKRKVIFQNKQTYKIATFLLVLLDRSHMEQYTSLINKFSWNEQMSAAIWYCPISAYHCLSLIVKVSIYKFIIYI